MEKIDFKKQDKDLYLPKSTPQLLTVPPILYLMVDGAGAPESQEYQQSVEMLYGIAWTIKMSKMGASLPDGYQEYVMPPLEGLWDCAATGYSPNRDSWRWTSLLRQPDFVTGAVLEWAKGEVAKKSPHLPLELVKLEVYDEGLSVQMMHHGPYSTEQETIDAIGAFIAQNRLVDDCSAARRHHEIYLSDPRRTKPENLKTMLRHPVVRG